MSAKTAISSRAFARVGRTFSGTQLGMVREMERSTLTAG